jgi:Holliday junction resolvase
MAKTPEGKVKDAVKKLLDKKGVYHFLPYMAGFGRSGIPDIIACVAGSFYAIECKAGTGAPTALQHRELKKITDAGGQAVVINEENIWQVEEYLNLMLATRCD